ncbi:hypothetical protein [Acinetobacter nosocomialis]|uniref:hypothetical protein n=1 Tax=Acinetobacter nosocomialis TaxID=106654 RepID=UPI000E6AD011|nr:hypothetical protein [Acinetobacter nosocomialis]
MFLEKIKSAESIPEMITLFITFNFIIQTSYKFGFLSSYGYWTISLYSPIEIMFGNLEMILTYILVFTYVIYDKFTIGSLIGIFTTFIVPFLSQFIYTGIFHIPIFSYFAIAIGVFGIALKSTKNNNLIETSLFSILLCILPLLYGFYENNSLKVEKLAKATLNVTTDNEWFILDKFSDNFLLINKDKDDLKVVKINDLKNINIK